MKVISLFDEKPANISNTQRYKMLGNGMTVDVIVELLRGMNEPVSNNVSICDRV